MSSPGRSLMRHADFLRLWIAETISQFGTQVSLLAVPLVAALILKVQPDEFALLGFFEFLPFILVSLPAGVWVDRLPRRPILIFGDLGRAVSLLSIPIAYELGVLSIQQLYVVGFVNGILTVFFDVAYQSYLPSLVDRDQIVEGNSKLEISRSAAQIAGPGVSGVLIGLVTAPIAIFLDALSFVGSALFLFLIRRPEPPPATHETGTRPSMATEVRAGLRYVLGHPYLRAIAASTGSSNLFSNVLFSIYLLYVANTLLLSPEQIGLVFGLGNLGVLVAALTANRIARRIGVGPAIVGSMAIFGPSMLLIAIAPGDASAIPYLIGSGLIGGFAGVVYNVNQVSFRQAITPPRMQGKMNATMRFIVWGTIPVGQIVGGQIAARFGLTTAIWVGAIGSCLAFLFVLLSPVRTLREIPAPMMDGVAAEAADAAGAATTLGRALDETPEPMASPVAGRVDDI